MTETIRLFLDSDGVPVTTQGALLRDRLKDVVLASVSNDLRTPLTTIKALAQEGALREIGRAHV